VSEPAPEGPSLFVHSLPGSFGDLGALGREVSLEPGDVLWKVGDSGDHVVLLVEGRLEVVHETPDDGEITLRHLYPGAVAGEMAAVDGQARSATVRAHSASRVVLVPARSFRDFLRAHPDVLEQLFLDAALKAHRQDDLRRVLVRAARGKPLPLVQRVGYAAAQQALAQ